MNHVSHFERCTVWEEGEGERFPFHVYGLHESTAGTILAYTEARIEPGDQGAHDLVLKRGIKNSSGTIEFGDAILIEDGAIDDGICWSNPTGLTDRETGRLFFFYVWNEGGDEQRRSRVFYRTSDDDGLHWSERNEITDLFTDNPYGWSFHMPGPGHGIQLHHQPDTGNNGRLLVQCWHRKAVNLPQREYGVSVFYSDDHGDTWHGGGDCGVGLNMNESRLIERFDGTVVLDARGSRHGGIDNSRLRIRAASRDGGLSFATPEERHGLQYTGCDSGLVAFEHDDRRIVLQSHPGEMDSRDRMVVSVSFDEAETWVVHREIDADRACYSDLVILNDGTVGLLWGQGLASREDLRKWVPARVCFVRCSIEWLCG